MNEEIIKEEKSIKRSRKDWDDASTLVNLKNPKQSNIEIVEDNIIFENSNISNEDILNIIKESNNDIDKILFKILDKIKCEKINECIYNNNDYVIAKYSKNISKICKELKINYNDLKLKYLGDKNKKKIINYFKKSKNTVFVNLLKNIYKEVVENNIIFENSNYISNEDILNIIKESNNYIDTILFKMLDIIKCEKINECIYNNKDYVITKYSKNITKICLELKINYNRLKLKSFFKKNAKNIIENFKKSKNTDFVDLLKNIYKGISGEITSMPMGIRGANLNQETPTIPVIRNKTPQTIILYPKKRRGRPTRSAKSKNAAKETKRLMEEFKEHNKEIYQMMNQIMVNMKNLMIEIHQNKSNEITLNTEMQCDQRIRQDKTSSESIKSENIINEQRHLENQINEFISNEEEDHYRLHKTYKVDKIVKPFRGENLKEWLAMLERYFQIYGINNEEDMHFILASKIDFKLYDENINEFSNISSYAALKAILIEKFDNKASKQNAEIELKIMKVEMKISDYKDIEKFANKASMLIKTAYSHLTDEQRFKRVAEMIAEKMPQNHNKLISVEFYPTSLQDVICYMKELFQKSGVKNKKINNFKNNPNKLKKKDFTKNEKSTTFKSYQKRDQHVENTVNYTANIDDKEEISKCCNTTVEEQINKD
ncbi:Hypothetical protein SRAE_X000256600 [Strongyloides ratti]|uniref:Uncharacterized protein n=1 Tax=Strongyloides ratti TaxID=34506 RepID=A0A090MRE8_STRRB|nr:Hypothetical protein SRAE_X000256600 [Strongyloides ratti]CEF60783.1 Hypothetical protein SRAE_X000256600 [Strongyloides ratti]